MRGKWGTIKTKSGDVMYDYAKLYQSILGYDAILFGFPINHNMELREYFLASCAKRGVFEEDIRVITLSLIIGYFWSIPDYKRGEIWEWLQNQNWNFPSYSAQPASDGLSLCP